MFFVKPLQRGSLLLSTKSSAPGIPVNYFICHGKLKDQGSLVAA